MESSLDDIQLCYEKAIGAYNAGRLELALQLVEDVRKVYPSSGDVLHLRGLIALSLNRAEEAESWFVQAIDASPDATFYNSLCAAQVRLKAFAQAAASARSGLVFAEDHQPDLDTSRLLYNLCLALSLGDKPEDAIDICRRTIERYPARSDGHSNLGASLFQLGKIDLAINAYRQAIKLNPNHLVARANLGYALLCTGDYEEAWPHFEHRWATVPVGDSAPGIKPPTLPIRRWLGQGLPRGEKRLLVFAEQGLGDTLQFCRYLEMALGHFTEVGFMCPKPLHRLLADSLCSRWSNLTLLEAKPLNALRWDWYSPLLSLPMAFGTRLDTIPADLPYLYADRRRSRKWSSKAATLAPGTLPRIGVVWAGGHSGTAEDRRRSINLETMAPLLAWPGAHWISLQKADDMSKALSHETYPRVVDWMHEVRDFADTAALIDALDLVISVDTAVAHLAASMGKRVWLLNRYAGCWRWLRNRDDSPWYPGMRIFTQTTRGNWTEVIERVLSELEFNAAALSAERADRRD
ncbi:tetratricopeptide repeat protein [Burkholderia lata]|uniref:tetratricopeptide repeat-containing glycosyltransferase family protein n=1 Tax=Burkholderia lata (strain ATCC 17760 / DSM 23089 / LMG 22485 / NCIMB 9086 / R18194 / 383) TaxID=482957 RepID=UPI0015836614|nr:tetratricopeptide repeat-containing glycosyltransferase family protein [Burkholderia lata]